MVHFSTATIVPVEASTTDHQAIAHISTETVVPVKGAPTVVLHTSTNIVQSVQPTSGLGNNKAVVTAEGRRNRRISFGAVVAFLGFAVLAL